MKRFLWMILVFSFCRAAISAAPAPTFENMAYGENSRNVLDLWIAEGGSPRPLLIYIHGGAWISNDKSQILGVVNITNWLAKGVSVASINYRYSTTSILPAPVLDAVRAIQFLRYKAAELNIDPSRIALQGGSAGACSALWIAFHDDVADPSAADPVLRESSRVRGVYAGSAQTSIDPVVLTEWISYLAASNSMINKAVGASSYSTMLANYAQHKPLFDEFSPINHMDAQDPAVFLSYPADMTLPPPDTTTAIHHGMFGVKLKEKADEVGYSKCNLSIVGTAVPEHFANASLFLESILLGADLPPVARSIDTIFLGNTVSSGKVTGSDPEGGSVTFALFQTATNGTLCFSGTTGNYTYQPAHGYSGTDTFIFAPVCDGVTGLVATATIVINSVVDTNSNRLPDEWEAAHGISDPDSDTDGDGFSNLQEYQALTDPQDDTDFPRVQAVIGNSSGAPFTLQWPAKGGVRYRVQYSDDLSAWTDVPRSANEEIQPGAYGADGTGAFADDWILTPQPESNHRFYRIRIL